MSPPSVRPTQFGRIYAPDEAWLAKQPQEPILEPDLPIIDTHHHLWERPDHRYLLHEFLDDVRTGHNIVATVFVECHAMYRAAGPEEMRPVGQTEFVTGMAAMRAIWTKSKPEYSGEHVHFPPMMTWPKPAQKPHPPVIVGGAYPHGARRAIAYGDGWLPHARRPAYGDVLGLLPDFRKMAVEAGREPASLPITVFGVAEDLDLIKRYRDAGVARLIFNVPPAKADEVLPLLDRCAALMRQASA